MQKQSVEGQDQRDVVNALAVELSKSLAAASQARMVAMNDATMSFRSHGLGLPGGLQSGNQQGQTPQLAIYGEELRVASQTPMFENNSIQEVDVMPRRPLETLLAEKAGQLIKLQQEDKEAEQKLAFQEAAVAQKLNFALREQELVTELNDEIRNAENSWKLQQDRRKEREESEEQLCTSHRFQLSELQASLERQTTTKNERTALLNALATEVATWRHMQAETCKELREQPSFQLSIDTYDADIISALHSEAELETQKLSREEQCMEELEQEVSLHRSQQANILSLERTEELYAQDELSHAFAECEADMAHITERMQLETNTAQELRSEADVAAGMQRLDIAELSDDRCRSLCHEVEFQEAELENREACVAEFRDTHAKYEFEHRQLLEQLERRERRLKRLERESRQWNAQAHALCTVESRLAAISNVCISNCQAGGSAASTPSTCTHSLLQASSAGSNSEAASIWSRHECLMSYVSAALRELGYDKVANEKLLGANQDITNSPDIGTLLQVSTLESAATAVRSELHELATQVAKHATSQPRGTTLATNVPACNSSARDWLRDLSAFIQVPICGSTKEAR